MSWVDSQPLVISAPILYRLLDGIHGEILVRRPLRKLDQLRVGGEAQGDDLLHGDARVHPFAAEDEIAEIFLGPDGAVIVFFRSADW